MDSASKNVVITNQATSGKRALLATLSFTDLQVRTAVANVLGLSPGTHCFIRQVLAEAGYVNHEPRIVLNCVEIKRRVEGWAGWGRKESTALM